MNTPYRIMVIGGRDFTDYKLLCETVGNRINWMAKLHRSVEIISGDCLKGADKLAKQYATDYHFDYVGYPADWNQYGKRAGAIRNRTMVDLCDEAVVFWDGASKGTKISVDMLREKFKEEDFENKVTIVNYTKI